MSTADSRVVTWIDLADPNRAELEAALGRTVHARALDQLLAPHQHRDDPRPTLEGHDDYVFGVFLVPELLDDAIRTTTLPIGRPAGWRRPSHAT